MNIAVIGTGNIGGRLLKVWAQKGHNIFIGARNPSDKKYAEIMNTVEGKITVKSIAEAASLAEVILLAVPTINAYSSAAALGPIEGKVIIDAMNAAFRKPDPYTKTSEAIIAATGSNHIVKCFNSVGAENMDNPIYGNQNADMFLCGNYASEKVMVSKLVEDCGFNAYDIGLLDKEPLLENMALLWASLANTSGLGRNIAFKILRR